MILARYTVETSVDKKKLWAAITDMPTWPTWDKQLEYVRPAGSVHQGVEGVLKAKKGPETKMVVTKMEPMHIFQMEAKFPLARLIFTHTLEDAGNTTRVIQQVAIVGLMGWFFGLMMRSAIRKNLPDAVRSFVSYANNY